MTNKSERHRWIIRSDKKLITCYRCKYRIGVDDLGEVRGGGSMHMPLQKIIYIGMDELTIVDAEKAVRVWNVKCSD